MNLTGKTAVITGCTSGIGREMMRVLALRGAHVVGTSRSLEQARAACRRVNGRTTPLALELSDFESVRECSKAVLRLDASIDILVLNAGIILDTWQQVRGIERQFMVNHLGHFLLTTLLLDRVVAAAQGRVVVVGSGSHKNAPPGGIQFADLSGREWHGRGYAHSKLANGLFSLELSRRLAGTRATSNCLTPGHTRTNILRDTSSVPRDDARTPGQGAATACYVAAEPALATVSGEYFFDCAIAAQSEYQKDVRMAAKLWDLSASLTAT